MDESMSEHSDVSDRTSDDSASSDSGSNTSSPGEAVETAFQLMMSEKNIWNKINTTYKKFEGFYHKINECYETGTYTDLKVFCEDGDIFRCHRLALAAASGFFYDLFREYPDQDVFVLKDIDSNTFREIILPYVYTGVVKKLPSCYCIYNALRASTIFRMSAIEDHCVHHLTQQNIPMDDYALDLYLYASASRKVVLLPALSRFILQNLDRFSRESKFLSMSGEDFSALLTYFHQTSSSASQETILLDTILRWVCHLTDIRENRKLYFTELAGKVEFRFVSAAYVSEYFDKNESHPSEIPGTSNLGLCSMISRKVSLHAYIRTTADTTCIFSLKGNVTEGIDWHRPCTLSPPAIKKMRIVESDGRLYYLKYQDERFTFGSSTAIDLCTDMQSLALPTKFGSIPDKLAISEGSRCHTKLFSLCSLQRKIYMRSNSVDVFQWYNTEVDSWSAIPETFSDNVLLKDIVSDGTRLYLIDLDERSRVSLFFAYDPRVEKTEKLCTERLVGCVTGWSEPAVYHKGRIYLPEDDLSHEYKDTFKMAVYDPIAGRWDVQNLRSYFFNYTSGRHLVSLGEYLWMFGWAKDKNYKYIFTQLYEAYAQTWVYPNDPSHYLHRAVLKANPRVVDLTDVIAF